ncbi:MAG: hypothetical protein ABSG56_02290 [Bryobacteraceae bacterium]|jgi:hypothetical protein
MSTDWKKDWKKIARANGLAIPDAALERIAQSLDTLEADFRPLMRALPPETEPALAFRAELSHDRKGVEDLA